MKRKRAGGFVLGNNKRVGRRGALYCKEIFFLFMLTCESVIYIYTMKIPIAEKYEIWIRFSDLEL